MEVRSSKKYNIGLDIGTTSVGWAVVESDNQKIVRKGNKRLWGVRLFEEATTAQNRRNARNTRRRYDRRRERIRLLQEEFLTEINKVDPLFYKKLSETFFHENDLLNKTIHLNEKEKLELKQYQRDFKTIYHLREKLINDSSKMDIRLVYLAIHHIIKYRGNFLYQLSNLNVSNLNINEKLENVFEEIITLCPELEISDEYKKLISFEDLSNSFMLISKSDRKVLIKNILEDICPKGFVNEFINMVNGNKFNIGKMLNLELDFKINFDGNDYDEKYEELENVLQEKIEILNLLKELYDMIFLKRLFNGGEHTSLSSLMVDKYNIHKNDLNYLKQILRSDKKLYQKVFRTKKEKCLYDKYIHNEITNAEFVDEIVKCINSIIEKMDSADTLRLTYEKDIKERIENGLFMPRITSVENGKYPYQLNKDELIKIIENQGKYYPFLLEKINGTYKLVKLLEFKIPYYVGPLNKNSDFAWLERKENNVKITPYNFDDIIDKEASAENFIKRMISRCTYLLEEPSIPNQSILYSKFKVMNELKQIRINGNKIENNLQHKIYNELFLNYANITDKLFKEYLYQSKDFDMYEGNFNITGYSSDGKFSSNMSSYIDFFSVNGIFENTKYDVEDAEQIIEWITIFEDKDILETKIRKNYPELTNNQINKILAKKYKGWSSLSKKLLTEKYYVEKDNLEKKSIIDLMYETDKNFMQILNDKEYNFQKMISNYNKIDNTKKIDYSLVEGLATSPSIKRGTYQALKVVDEIVDYMGYNPETIMIEMARGNEEKKRKDDRKKYLLNLYEKSKNEIEEYNHLNQELNKIEKIDTQKLFLYFIQEGKSLYSGKPLNIEDLDSYEIDHIIPQTLIKDDSIDNKALVYREENQNKAAHYILPKEYRNNFNITWWKHLRKIGLISPKKFHSLIRNEFKAEDIEGFINRQLVETRQITKHVANILGNYYENTKIIYLKANLSHNYRERYELFKFRSINDYHHAHDAYLAAVLGEYNEKHLKRKITFDMIKELNSKLYEMKEYQNLKYGYVINSLDSNVFDLLIKLNVDDITGEILFDPEYFRNTVENNLYCNDIIISKKTEIKTGEFYKQTIYGHKDSKIKSGIRISKNLPVEVYGCYTGLVPSYLTLFETEKGKNVISIPILLKNHDKLNYISEKSKNNLENIKIIKEIIPFQTMMKYNNQLVYITGASELVNAIQLKISKNDAKKWKYTLNWVLNDRKIPEINKLPILSNEQLENQIEEIIEYLLKQKEKYPLFTNTLNKFDNINIKEYSIELKKQILIELFKLFSANPQNANLSFIGLTEREGRLNYSSIKHGTIIFKSVTGIKETKYEF